MYFTTEIDSKVLHHEPKTVLSGTSSEHVYVSIRRKYYLINFPLKHECRSGDPR